MRSNRPWLAILALLISHESLLAQNPGGIQILGQQGAGTPTATATVVTGTPIDLAGPRTIPVAQTPQQRGLSIHRRSQMLMARYGSARAALGKVIDARGGDGPGANRFTPWARQCRAEVEAITGPLTDVELRDIDHYLNTHAAAQHVLPIEADDGWFTRTGKIFGKQFVSVAMTGVTAAYTGVKWFDQTFDTGVGKVVGHDFNSANTSRASWEEMWHGVAGAWVGTYDTAAAPTQ